MLKCEIDKMCVHAQDHPMHTRLTGGVGGKVTEKVRTIHQDAGTFHGQLFRSANFKHI